VKKRTDLERLRVVIHEFHKVSAEDLHGRKDWNTAEAGHSVCSMAPVLEREFVLRLSPRLNIVEPERTPLQANGAVPADLKTTAEHHRANAILVGEYVEIGDQVYVSLRIVEVETMLVIAAARGVFAADSLRLLGGADAHEEKHHEEKHHEPRGYPQFR
jgi:hypothetical protein